MPTQRKIMQSIKKHIAFIYDGGDAFTDYTNLDTHDGGDAFTDYTTLDTIDGGDAFDAGE